MNKSEFVNFISENQNVKKSDAEKYLHAVIDSLEKALSTGKSVNLMGFGSWNVVERAAREGHHPRTGEKIHIPACKQLSFKVGKRLKEICNNSVN